MSLDSQNSGVGDLDVALHVADGDIVRATFLNREQDKRQLPGANPNQLPVVDVRRRRRLQHLTTRTLDLNLTRCNGNNPSHRPTSGEVGVQSQD